jgi:hypothetical protein
MQAYTSNMLDLVSAKSHTFYKQYGDSGILF